MKKISKILLLLVISINIFTCFITIPSVKADEVVYTYAYLNDDYVRTRSCPSTSCDALLHNGSTIYLSNPRVVEIIGYEGEWAKITYNYWGFTFTGYIMKAYLGGIKSVTLDQNYINELISKGFPRSYANKLAKIHAIHPTWIFNVSNTNVSLAEAVEQEYNPIYKNLISTSNTNLLSTDPAAYSNGSFVQFEPGWYAPSKNTISYYLDPRNFLDDNSIFMFEQLSYDDKQTEEIVQLILNGSFMEGTYQFGAETKSFAATFVEAGRKYNVSPVHLAARVIQEQGYSGSLTSYMDGGDGQIYYNYFNFNASGSTTSEIVAGALSYAKTWGWNNPYYAIMGGAEDISDGYINNNQDTLYYQKFNIIGGGQYWHQYMANIQAPYREGYVSYTSYFESNLLNTAFTFKIPVYSDMQESVEIATKSNNNNLSSINLSKGILYPGFDSSITTYNLDLSSNTNAIDVEAIASDNKAKVEGTGTIDITNKNEIVIKVTAEDDTVKEYKIAIHKKSKSEEKVEDVVREMKYTVKETSISGFKLGQDVNNIISEIKNTFDLATIKIYDSSNNEKNSGLITTGDKIEININDSVQTYDVVIYGDTSGDGKISTLDYSKIKAHIQGTKKLEGIYLSASDTSKDGKISTLDYSKIKAHIQGTKTLEQ